MNLTHHDALNIPNKRPLSPSHSDLYSAKREKPPRFQLSIKVEFIIQLPACCWEERQRAAKHLGHVIQKWPSQYFLIKPWASRLHARRVCSPARFHCQRRKNESIQTGSTLCVSVWWTAVSVVLSAGCQHLFHRSPVYPLCLIHAASDLVLEQQVLQRTAVHLKHRRVLRFCCLRDMKNDPGSLGRLIHPLLRLTAVA